MNICKLAMENGYKLVATQNSEYMNWVTPDNVIINGLIPNTLDYEWFGKQIFINREDNICGFRQSMYQEDDTYVFEYEYITGSFRKERSNDVLHIAKRYEDHLARVIACQEKMNRNAVDPAF